MEGLIRQLHLPAPLAKGVRGGICAWCCLSTAQPLQPRCISLCQAPLPVHRPCLQGGLEGTCLPPLLRRSHPHLHSLGSAASEGPEPAVSPGALLESEPVTPAVPRSVSLESGGVILPLPGGVQEVGDKGCRADEGRIWRTVLPGVPSYCLGSAAMCSLTVRVQFASRGH